MLPTNCIDILLVRAGLDSKILVNLYAAVLLDGKPRPFEELGCGCNADAHNDEVCWKGLSIDDDSRSDIGVVFTCDNLLDFALHVELDTIRLVVLVEGELCQPFILGVAETDLFQGRADLTSKNGLKWVLFHANNIDGCEVALNHCSYKLHADERASNHYKAFPFLGG